VFIRIDGELGKTEITSQPTPKVTVVLPPPSLYADRDGAVGFWAGGPLGADSELSVLAGGGVVIGISSQGENR
jgi:hypothetical protein